MLVFPPDDREALVVLGALGGVLICKDCDLDCGGDLDDPSRRIGELTDGVRCRCCCCTGGGGTSSGDELDNSKGEVGLP